MYCTVIYCTILYYAAMYLSQAIDWLHHLLMVVVGGPLLITAEVGPLMQYNHFFMCGVPGECSVVAHRSAAQRNKLSTLRNKLSTIRNTFETYSNPPEDPAQAAATTSCYSS